MTTGTLTLADFLLARFNEGQHRAQMAWQGGGGSRKQLWEWESKIRVVEAAPEKLGPDGAEWLFSLLAMPYQAHRDFREEWRL